METYNKVMTSLLVVITILMVATLTILLTGQEAPTETPVAPTPTNEVDEPTLICPNVCDAICAGDPEPNTLAECPTPMCDCGDEVTVSIDIQDEDTVGLGDKQSETSVLDNTLITTAAGKLFGASQIDGYYQTSDNCADLVVTNAPKSLYNELLANPAIPKENSKPVITLGNLAPSIVSAKEISLIGVIDSKNWSTTKPEGCTPFPISKFIIE